MLVDYCPQTAGRGNKKRLSQWDQNHIEFNFQFLKPNFFKYSKSLVNATSGSGKKSGYLTKFLC